MWWGADVAVLAGAMDRKVYWQFGCNCVACRQKARFVAFAYGEFSCFIRQVWDESKVLHAAGLVECEGTVASAPD